MPTGRRKGESPDTRTVDPNEPFEETPVSPAAEAPDTERIRERAHRIWQEEGCPEGRADEHWQRAKRELSRSRAGE